MVKHDPNRTPIDLPPPLKGRCRGLLVAAHTLYWALPFLTGLWAGWQIGWLYGFFAWLAALFGTTIALSKLKQAYVPPGQHELPHGTRAILHWSVWRRFCL